MISLLQLETNFPRILGDVGCAETYLCPLETLVVNEANVTNIVSSDVTAIPLGNFVTKLEGAKGQLVTTSCGFLSVCQKELAVRTHLPFVSSALLEVPKALAKYGVKDVAILTFNVTALTEKHFGGVLPNRMHWTDLQIISLDPNSHLRQVVEKDQSNLNKDLAEREIIELLEQKFGNAIPKCLILECTNLPPYKEAIKAKFNIEIFDILTAIEAQRPMSIKPEYL